MSNQARTEASHRWWLQYVIVPVIAACLSGGGIVAFFEYMKQPPQTLVLSPTPTIVSHVTNSVPTPTIVSNVIHSLATPTHQPTTTQPANNRIALNQTVSGELFFNEWNDWTFSDGPATLNIILDVGPFGNGLIILLDPNGVEREYVDVQVGGEERLVNYQIPSDGDYTIRVRNTNNDQANYTLTVESAQPVNNRIALNQTVSGQLFFNEWNDWTFSDGPATLNIILDVGPFGNGLIILLDPNGVQEEYVDVQVRGEERLVNYQIPTDGDYTIRVRNTNNDQANYTLTLESAK